MLASIIIPTFNGKDKLIKLLQSLEKQNVSNVEIIVVIDGSTDGTLHSIQSIPWKLNDLKLIEQKNKGRAGARNTGAREATTELIIFFDDDMIVDSACIETHIKAHTSNPNTIYMGQVIEPSKPHDPEIKLYKDYLNQSWAKVLEPYKNNNIAKHLTILSAQNVSISATVFNKLQGFDERLKDIEDYDFALRAKEEHISIFYLDTAIAIHTDFFDFQKYATRSKDYLKNRKLASQLKPELYISDRILTHTIPFGQRSIYAVLKYPLWLWILDNFNFFKCLYPKKMRYKLYGIIITAYIHGTKDI